MKIETHSVIKVDDEYYFVIYINPDHPSVARLSKYDFESKNMLAPEVKWLMNKKLELINNKSGIYESIFKICKDKNFFTLDDEATEDDSQIEQQKEENLDLNIDIVEVKANPKKEEKEMTNNMSDNKNINIFNGKSWAAWEEEYLQNNWGILSLEEVMAHLNRSKMSIRTRASKLNLGPQKNIINSKLNDHNIVPESIRKLEDKQQEINPDYYEKSESLSSLPLLKEIKSNGELIFAEDSKPEVGIKDNSKLGSIEVNSNGIKFMHEDIAKLKEEIYQYKTRWQRIKEITFAIMHYTNDIKASELMHFMDKLEGNCNYDPLDKDN